MNFADLKKSLKSNICNNYLLVGGDLFLLGRSYELILGALNLMMPDLNVQAFMSEDIDLARVVDACNVLPIMDEYRVVYVNASIKCDIHNAKALKEYFDAPNPSTILIINAGENTREFEPYKSNFEIVDCDKVTRNIIEGFIVNAVSKHGKQITADAVAQLIDYTNGDMSHIDNEIVKLVSYVGDRQTIQIDDVLQIVTKSIEFQIFELTDALAKKNGKRVYEILDVVRAKKDSYRTIITLIYNHFRRLFHISIAKCSRAELAQMLGIKEFAVNRLFEQSKLFSPKQLKIILDECVRLDYELKCSNYTVDNAVEYLVLRILNI